MTEQDWMEMLSEPAGGHNHGRKRSPEGDWAPLETDDSPSYKGYVEPRKHGTQYVYQEIGCRCGACRAWKSDENRAYREKVRPIGE